MFFEDNHVEVNKESNFYTINIDGSREEIPFRKEMYDNLDDVISEVFNSYVSKLNKDDIFCIAMHNRHNKVITNGLIGHKTVLSFFENRYKQEDKATKALLARADYIVTDSKKKCDEIKEYMGDDSDKVVNITPFDTRKESGISSQLTVQKILVAIDNLPSENLEKLVLIFAKYFSYTIKKHNSHGKI